MSDRDHHLCFFMTSNSKEVQPALDGSVTSVRTKKIGFFCQHLFAVRHLHKELSPRNFSPHVVAKGVYLFAQFPPSRSFIVFAKLTHSSRRSPKRFARQWA